MSILPALFLSAFRTNKFKVDHSICQKGSDLHSVCMRGATFCITFNNHSCLHYFMCHKDSMIVQIHKCTLVITSTYSYIGGVREIFLGFAGHLEFFVGHLIIFD